MKADLILTDHAAYKVKSLIDEEGNPNLKLRVSVRGGGCSGFEYVFTFDEALNPEQDYVVEKKCGDKPDDAVFLVVNAISHMYLRGAEIDYREDINGSQFVIRNPNAKRTCGCGSSFSIDD